MLVLAFSLTACKSKSAKCEELTDANIEATKALLGTSAEVQRNDAKKIAVEMCMKMPDKAVDAASYKQSGL